MTETGRKMRFQAMDFINGLTAESTSATGKETSWMNSVFILGKTGGCMRVITWKIRSMGMEFILGQILNDTQAGGLMVNSMASASSFPKMARKNWVFGKMARKLSGSTKMK